MSYFVTGADGQLGRALQRIVDGKFTDTNDLDITSRNDVLDQDISPYEAVINAAAFTNVDGAELSENNSAAWSVNVEGTGYLALLARKNDLPLVHVSTDYVFDGTKSGEYTEDDTPNPLSMYGLTKWMSEAAAKESPKHYVLRTSWVIGDGDNFVRTMLKLGQTMNELSIVSDQIGRPTFTNTLAEAAVQFASSKSEFGIYNVSNSGGPVSWADFARSIFEEAKLEVNVTDVTTKEYFKDKPHAARPLNSVFNLEKSLSAGIIFPDWRDELIKYIAENKGS